MIFFSTMFVQVVEYTRENRVVILGFLNPDLE